ncbi:hypothetical protein ACVIM7_000416 [Bradyrhizobium liaoningense]
MAPPTSSRSTGAARSWSTARSRLKVRATALVTVYRGIERESYSCVPLCQRRVTLGDSDAYFNNTMSQAGSLSSSASGSAKPN